MRVLLIHRWFWPDAPPYASMLRSIGRQLVADGHEVAVLTAQPSYNRETQKKKCPPREQLDGMHVHRVELLPESKRNYVARFLNMLLFMRAIMRKIHRQQPGFDVVMASTMPPVLVAAAARRAAKARGARFLYHMMDIYPEIAMVSGMKREGWLARFLSRIDFRNCAEAACVIVLSADMKKSLQQRGVPLAHVVVRNNFRLESFSEEKESYKAQTSITGDSFCLLFAGNLGRFQGLEPVIQAVRLLHQDSPQLQLHFLGDGVGRGALEELSGELLGKNIFFHGYLPLEDAAQKIKQADLSLISLNPGIIRYAYPSKTMTCLAEGSPLFVIVEEESELAQMVRDERIGYVAPQEDIVAIANVLRQAMQESPTIREQQRKNALALAEKEFSAVQAMAWWSELFAKLEEESQE